MSQGDIFPNWFELSDGSNSVSVTFFEALQYSQDYSNIGGSSVLRMMNGRAIKQTHWSKLTTTISGSGHLPPGLSTLDYSGELLLKCGATRSVTSLTTTVALPKYRNNDIGVPTTDLDFRMDDVYVPQGRAFVDGFWEPTPVALAGNVATCTVVPGATRYRVDYFPEIVVYFETEPTDGYAYSEDSSSSWSFTAVQK